MESIDKAFYHYRQHPQSVLHSKRKDVHLSFNMVSLVCDTWRSQGAIEGNEEYLLSNLLLSLNVIISPFTKYGAELYKKYSKSILNSFGDDIYNSKVVNELSGKSLDILKN